MSITPEELKANRLKWIEALESGKYEQGWKRLCVRGYGSRPDQFCCLGVAREVLGGGEDDYDAYLLGDDTGEKVFTEEDNNSHLDAVLVGMNDKYAASFMEIATHLRGVWNLPKDETKPIGGAV